MFMIFSLMPEPSGVDAQQQEFGLATYRWLLLLYPVFGLIFGWLGGLIGSYLYNFIAARVGGLQLEYSPRDTSPTSPAA